MSISLLRGFPALEERVNSPSILIPRQSLSTHWKFSRFNTLYCADIHIANIFPLLLKTR